MHVTFVGGGYYSYNFRRNTHSFVKWRVFAAEYSIRYPKTTFYGRKMGIRGEKCYVIPADPDEGIRRHGKRPGKRGRRHEGMGKGRESAGEGIRRHRKRAEKRTSD